MQLSEEVKTPENSKAPDPSSIYNPKGLATELKNIKNRITDVLDPMAQLEASGEQLAETFGFAGDRVTEMETQINKSASSLLQFSKNAMTYESALKRAGEIVKEVSIVTNRNVIASTDVIKSLEITAEATGVSTKDLAQNFTDVGFQLTDVQKQMSTAASVAQRLGVNVGAVTKGVSDNLKNLNIYNFQGGVEGLAKMVAKSAVLGVNMGNVFSMAEKAFDPEQAIDLAASMQRLGVATSDLLDPLKIMDLGQNNPDELMNQIVNVTKGLTKIDETSGKVTILPGEQGRMRELAKAMDMPVAELAKMAIKSGELEYKMKKIAFPKMDIPMTEENKEMIANLASFGKDFEGKKGFVVTVKEDGKEKEKLVSELNPDDVAFLKEQATPKSLEKLAEDQLTVSQKMLKELEYISSSPRAGLSRSKEASEVRRDLDKTISKTKEGAFQKDEKTGEDLYDKMEKSMGGVAKSLLKELPNALQSNLMKLIAGEEVNTDKLFGDLTNIGAELKAGSVSAGKDLINVVQNAINNAKQPTSTKTSETTTTTTETKKPEENLTWFEQIDATMENYRKSLEPKVPTTITPETKKEETKQDLITKEESSMRKLLEQPTTKTETQPTNLTPIVDTNILQTDRLIGRLDTLIDVTKQNKLIIDYDKFKYKNENDQTLLTSLDSLTKQMKECCSDKGKKLEIEKIEKPTIVENKETKTNEIIKENNFVEVKPETPKTTEFDFSKFSDTLESNNEKLTNGLRELKNTTNPKPTIVENKETKTNEIIKENKTFEIKSETSKTPEIDIASIVDSSKSNTEKLAENINSLKDITADNKITFDYEKISLNSNLDEVLTKLTQPLLSGIDKYFSSINENVSSIKNTEPTIVENKQIEQKEIIKENKILEIKPEIPKMPEFDTNSIASAISNQTDKFVDNLNSLKETTKENKMDIDYEKFVSKTSSNEDFKTLITPLIDKFGDAFTSVENKVSGIKNFEPTIVENKETKTNEIIKEKEFVEIKPEITKMPEFDTNSIASAISNQTDKFVDNLNSLKETTKENKMNIDYDKFASKTSSNEDFITLITPLMDKFGDAFTSVENKVSGIKNPEPTIVENKEIKTNEIIKETEFVEIKPEITKMPEFDTNSIASAISNQTDKFSDNLNSLKETTKENKIDIDYNKFISNTSPDENYLTLIQPMIDKFGDAFTSVENKISGIKNFEPTVVEKQELKEIKIEQEPLKIESFKETPMIAPEKNMAGVTIDGLQKINESKLPESAVRNNPEIAPLTMKTESTTNVGGEITVVVDVRGVQNDASRLIIDEVTKKINSGEFTNALITQIKNKESAYGQLAGQQYTTPPGFV